MPAGQALSVQDATNKRLALAIGLSYRFMIEDNPGLDYSRPNPHTRDYLTILQGLLTGEPVSNECSEYHVNTAGTVAGTEKPPILVATLGPHMLNLCGRWHLWSLGHSTITWMGGINYLCGVAVPKKSSGAAVEETHQLLSELSGRWNSLITECIMACFRRQERSLPTGNWPSKASDPVSKACSGLAQCPN